MNFVRIEFGEESERNSGKVFRSAIAVTCSEGATSERMVLNQEPNDENTSSDFLISAEDGVAQFSASESYKGKDHLRTSLRMAEFLFRQIAQESSNGFIVGWRRHSMDVDCEGSSQIVRFNIG